MASSPEVRVFSQPEELFLAAAQEFTTRTTEAMRAHGSFRVALSGGSTPRSLYSLLASESQSAIPWDKVIFFWGDERHVPPQHSDSNYQMANEALLSKVPVKLENVFRVRSEMQDAQAAAEDYQETLKRAFRLRAAELPRFDLILLGMGPDGHTASLFPKTKALKERSRLVVANWVEKFKTFRITLTVPVLNNAVCVMFMVMGEDKAAALASVFDPMSDPDEFPAKMVEPSNGKLIWLVGREAGGESLLRTQARSQ